MFFYACEDYHKVQSLYHTDYICKVSLQYELFHAFVVEHEMQRIYHIAYIHKVSL